MDHLREGIHWISVGQRDPLVEYRRQGQHIFEEMQGTLRHDVLRAIFHAQPIDEDELDEPIETELTRAARGSVANADKVIDAEEFHEVDFVPKKIAQATKNLENQKRKKLRKAERQRRAKGKKRK